MVNEITLTLPIRTVSEANISEHWSKRAKRRRQQAFLVRHAFSKLTQPITLPCEITLTRLSPRLLDQQDNLPMSFKSIVDQLSECLIPEKAGHYITKDGARRAIRGRADDDNRLTWEFSQEKSKIAAIRIEMRF